MYPFASRRILLVDDDSDFRERVRSVLDGAYQLIEAASEQDFHRLFTPYTYDLVILDMRLKSGYEGLALLREIYALDDLQPTIMISSYGTSETAIEAIDSGALMFLNKEEFSPSLIARVVEAILQQGRMTRRLAILEGYLQSEMTGELIGMSSSIGLASRKIRKAVGDPGSTILLLGEPGTGRDFVARLIFQRSPTRSAGAFISMGSDMLRQRGLETILFGAKPISPASRKKGLVEQTNGGVISVQDIDSCPMNVLTELIETIGRKQIKIPETEISVPIDCQLMIMAAPDSKAISTFLPQIELHMPASRIIEISLPPLRERREDIPLLSTYFLQLLRRKSARMPQQVSRQVIESFESHEWFGNVRELKATLQYAAMQASIELSEEILVRHLPYHMRSAIRANQIDTQWDYRFELARAEMGLVDQALSKLGDITQEELAKVLGYNDRYILRNHIKKILGSFPCLAQEYEQVADKFPSGSEGEKKQ